MMMARKGSTLRTDFFNGIRHFETFLTIAGNVALRTESRCPANGTLGALPSPRNHAGPNGAVLRMSLCYVGY